MKLPALCCVAASLLGLSCAHLDAQTLNFDDLGSGLVASGYAGLNWDNVYSLNTLNFGPSGYVNGTVSPNTVIYNGWGDTATFSSATAFNLISLDLTAAWEEGLQVAIVGYDNNANQLYQAYLTLSSAGPTFLTTNFTGVYSVSIFTSTDGAWVNDPSFAGSGAEVAIDNLTISGLTVSPAPAPVPEPGTYGVAASLGFLGLLLTRRRRASVH